MDNFSKIAEAWTGLDQNDLAQIEQLTLPTRDTARSSFESVLNEETLDDPATAVPRLMDLLNDATPEEAEEIHHMLRVFGHQPEVSERVITSCIDNVVYGMTKKSELRRSIIMRILNDIKRSEDLDFSRILNIDDVPFSGGNKFILDVDLSIFWMPTDTDGNYDEDGYPFHSHVIQALEDKLSDETFITGYFANGPEPMMGTPAFTAQLFNVEYDEIPDFYQEWILGLFKEAKLINWNDQTVKDEREPEDPTLNDQFYDGDQVFLTQDVGEFPAGDAAEFVSRRPGGQTAWLQTSDGMMTEVPFEAFEKTADSIFDTDAMQEQMQRLQQQQALDDEERYKLILNYEDPDDAMFPSNISPEPDVNEDTKFVIDLTENKGYFWDGVYEHSEIINAIGMGDYASIGSNPRAGDEAIAGYIEEDSWDASKFIEAFGEDEAKDKAIPMLEGYFPGIEIRWNDDIVKTAAVDFQINDKVLLSSRIDDEWFIEDLDQQEGYVVALENPRGEPRIAVKFENEEGIKYIPYEMADRLMKIQGARPFIFVVAPDGRTEREYTDQGQNFHNELARRLGAEEIYEVDEDMDEVPTGDVEEHGFVRGVWDGNDFFAIPEWNEEYDEAPVFTEEQKATIAEYIQEIGPEAITGMVLMEDGEGEYDLNSFIRTAAVVNEDGTIGFEGEDLGSNHKFILTPDGEFYAWGKKNFDYGKGMLAIEHEGSSWDELDDFTRYEWERDSSDTYDFYRQQGYATGNTSSGGFFMLNAPSGLNQAQIEAVEGHLRDAGHRSIVIHESGTRNFFNRAKDALDWLSPRRNPEPTEKDTSGFFENSPEEALLPKGANLISESARYRDGMDSDKSFVIDSLGNINFSEGGEMHFALGSKLSLEMLDEIKADPNLSLGWIRGTIEGDEIQVFPYSSDEVLDGLYEQGLIDIYSVNEINYDVFGRAKEKLIDIMDSLPDHKVWMEFSNVPEYQGDIPGAVELLSSVGMDKEGMAAQTGDPTFDALLEEFKDEFIDIEWFNPEFDETEDRYITIRELEDADLSVGQCGRISNFFESWLRTKGVRSVDHGNTENQGPAALNYTDESNRWDYSDDSHGWTEVYLNGHTYAVDWTASQYGNYDFPMVQRMDDGLPQTLPTPEEAYDLFGIDTDDYESFVNIYDEDEWEEESDENKLSEFIRYFDLEDREDLQSWNPNF